MSNYRKIVSTCPECSGITMFDLRAEIVCQDCGLVIHSTKKDQITVYVGNNGPLLYETNNLKIPHNTHVVSVVERVGLKMLLLEYGTGDLL